jgi:hypothetical protein
MARGGVNHITFDRVTWDGSSDVVVPEAALDALRTTAPRPVAPDDDE